MLRSLSIALVALAALGIHSCKWGKHTLPIMSPYVVEAGDTIYKTLPEFEFINQNGVSVSREDFLGKVFVADFFFVSCPTICPVMSKNVKKIYEKYQGHKDFRILSHSIDSTDSIPVLKAYAKGLGVDLPTWHFVTGVKDSIYNIGYDFYMATMAEDGSPSSGGYVHSGGLILVDKRGRIRGIYDGTNDAQTGQLISDLTILLKDARIE